MKLLTGALLTLALVLAATAVRADDPPKKGQLPPNWAKLGLTDKQKTEIYEVQSDYKSQIDALQKQIAALREKERTALFTILTDAQKARLKEILLEKGSDTKPEKSSSKPSDKTGDKSDKKTDGK